MKAEELRIGNYVRKVKDIQLSCDEVVKISSINKHGFLGLDLLKDYSIKSIPIDWIGSIELTEEWLIKMGFEKHEYKVSDCDYFTKGFVVIMVKDNNFKASVSDLQSRYLTSIQYIHQLQNLYFALTGEELTIKN